jgi:alpha,alpha-trehalose phosphorylase
VLPGDLAAEVGLPHLAHDYVLESALADIRDAEHDSSDGLHIAALAGTWLALVCGFGGLRHTYSGRRDDGLSFRPVLPDALSRLRYRLLFRDRLLRVTVEQGTVTYELLRGEPLTVRHEHEVVELAVDAPVSRATAVRPRPPSPRQPETRAPGRGTLHDDSRPEMPASAGHHEQA